MSPTLIHLTAAAVVGYSTRLSPFSRLVGGSTAISLARGRALMSSAEDAGGTTGQDGHEVKGMLEPTEEELALQKRVMAHQKSAPRLSSEVEARSIVQYSTGYAVISTASKQHEGYPNGGVVGFAPGPNKGMPVFFFSTMSGHTQDLLASPKASLTVTASGFTGASDGRVNLMGQVRQIEGDDNRQAARDAYLAKHPDAFWIDFGDFIPFELQDLVAVRFVGGFARAADVDPAAFLAANPDPILAFSGPVAGHMNADHSDATAAMVRHYIGLDADKAEIASVDSLGMTVKVTVKGGVSKMRLPFPRPAADRKDVKTLIVEMTQASAQG